MKKKMILLAVLVLCSACFANDPNSTSVLIPYEGVRTVRAVVIDFARYLDPNSLVCDIGCADGNVLAILSRLGFRVVGVEKNPLEVRRARRRGFAIRKGDVCEVGFPPADAYYLWANHLDASPIIEKIFKDDMKKLFVIGHYNWVYRQFFKSKGAIEYRTETHLGTFTWLVWDRR